MTKATHLPILSVPPKVEPKAAALSDLLYTAWSRGAEGRRWSEVEPLLGVLDKKFSDELNELLAPILEHDFGALLPMSCAPLDGTRIDLWDTRGNRITDASFYNKSREEGIIDGKWSVPNSQPYEFELVRDRFLGWSPIPVPNEEDD